MKDNIKLKLPLIVLGYDEKSLFSVQDAQGNVFMPVFTAPDRALSYKNFFKDQNLQYLVLNNVEDAVSVFVAIGITDNVLCGLNPLASRDGYIALNPHPDNSKTALCFGIEEFVNRLKALDQSKGPKSSDDS